MQLQRALAAQPHELQRPLRDARGSSTTAPRSTRSSRSVATSVRPSFLRMVADILRFNRSAPALLSGTAGRAEPRRLPRSARGIPVTSSTTTSFPMGAAIWSSRPVDMLRFPARFFVEFFCQSRLPERRPAPDLAGDSRRLDGNMSKRLTASYAQLASSLNTPVASIQRQPRRGPSCGCATGPSNTSTKPSWPVTAIEALKLLSDPIDGRNARYWEPSPTRPTKPCLHTDERLMPHRPSGLGGLELPSAHRAVRARDRDLQHEHSPGSLTRARPIPADPEPQRRCRSAQTRARQLRLPSSRVFTPEAVAAQKRRHREINGARRHLLLRCVLGFRLPRGWRQERSRVSLHDFEAVVQAREQPASTKGGLVIGALSPTRHRFRYRLFMMYLDLAELPRLFDGTPGWSAQRRALAWFKRSDYLGPSGQFRSMRRSATWFRRASAPGRRAQSGCSRSCATSAIA